MKVKKTARINKTITLVLFSIGHEIVKKYWNLGTAKNVLLFFFYGRTHTLGFQK